MTTSNESKFHLRTRFFEEQEKVIAEYNGLRALAFQYESGVCGLRLVNNLGQLTLLPFQGQQIWSAEFYGRDLTMKSVISMPLPTQEFLKTFGGFLVHCGALAVGSPSKDDHHPLHGELPNAPYQKAYLVCGQDEAGFYLGLGGEYHHCEFFGANYIASPLVKLYQDSTIFKISMTVTNLKKTEMELFYLAHANFRPIDFGRLVYSARCTPEKVRVRRSIPAHIKPKPGYKEFIEELAIHPEKADLLTPGLLFDPEIVFFIDYLPDAEGWAHTLQIHPSGEADYIRHHPEQLNKGIRWMCRTPDQDALGFEPATAEPEGYTIEKAKGNARLIPSQGSFTCEMEMGSLSSEGVQKVLKKIEDLRNQTT